MIRRIGVYPAAYAIEREAAGRRGKRRGKRADGCASIWIARSPCSRERRDLILRGSVSLDCWSTVSEVWLRGAGATPSFPAEAWGTTRSQPDDIDKELTCLDRPRPLEPDHPRDPFCSPPQQQTLHHKKNRHLCVRPSPSLDQITSPGRGR